MTKKKILKVNKKINSSRIQGKSVLGIVKELERLGIKSPTGKATWLKRSVDVMLSNEEYMGNVRLLDNGKSDSYYRVENNNPAIISKETFQAVQIEKQQRSNVLESEEGNKRKSKKIQFEAVTIQNSLTENCFSRW